MALSCPWSKLCALPTFCEFYWDQANENRKEWELKGRDIVKALMEER
jgi:hypothetical protein